MTLLSPYLPDRSTVPSRLAAVLLAVMAITGVAAAAPELRVETRPGGLAFHLPDADGAATWLLQHSPDGSTWDGVLFFALTEKGSAPPELVIPFNALADPAAQQGLFRAVQFDTEDAFHRRFLAERTKWRLSGVDDYNYELRQNFGQISWRGTIEVVDGEVDSFTTIDLQPPVVGNPEIPGIDRLFERIANAIAADAHEIRVTWDRSYGYPVTCYIDLEEFLADEESGWSILSFTPAP